MSAAVKPWADRMPAPRKAFACDMNCSGVGKETVREVGCGDCMRITIYGDPVKARDDEIAELRAALADRQVAAPGEANGAIKTALHYAEKAYATPGLRDARKAMLDSVTVLRMNLAATPPLCPECQAREAGEAARKDLVAELRMHAANTNHQLGRRSSLMREAADEIDRLAATQPPLLLVLPDHERAAGKDGA